MKKMKGLCNDRLRVVIAVEEMGLLRMEPKIKLVLEHSLWFRWSTSYGLIYE